MPRHPASGFVWAFLLALCGAVSLAAAPPESAVAGELANGVRYVVVPHASPRGDTSLRLVVGAGWLDERDGERSFAHLVEHLGFAGTRSHPGGTLPRFMQTLGLTWGADLNARTLPGDTVYRLDLPPGKATELPTALQVLRDFMDGVEFAPDAVAREAAIVASELRARDTLMQRVNLRLRDRLYAAVRAPEPAVEAVAGQLAQATPEALRTFHARNYRADRCTVIVVGPVKPDDIVAGIAAAFGSLAVPTGALPPRPPVVPPAVATMPVDLLRQPTIKAAIVELVSIQPQAPDDEAGRRSEIVREVARRALEARWTATLMASALEGSVRLIETPGLGPTVVESHLQLQTGALRWAEGVMFVENELRRLREFGLLRSEVSEAVAGLRAERRGAETMFAGLSSADVSTRVERAVLAARRWQSPAVERKGFDEVANDLKAEEVSAAARAIFADGSLQLVLVAPEKLDGGPAEVRTAWEQSARRRLSAPVDVTPLQFYYTDFGPAGVVTSRASETDLGLERVAFANGVRLNVRPSELEPGRFQLEVAFRQNATAVPKNRPGFGEIAAAMFTAAHTGKHLDGEIKRLLAQHGVTREFDTAHGAGRLDLSGPSRELGFALRLVAAWLSDLQPDPAMFRANLARYAGMREARMRDPGRRAMWEVEHTLAGDDARLQLPALDRVNGYDFNEVKTWLTTWWLQGPVDVGLVGDLSSETAIAQVAATLGALPLRVAPKPPRPFALERGASRRTVTAGAPAGTASACVAWPVATGEPRADAALELATDVLRDRLLRRLREQLGATYSPGCGVRRDPLQREFGFVWMQHTFKPEQAGALTDQALAIATQLAREGATAEEFARLREPARVRAAENLADDRWWLRTVVTPAQSQPGVLEMARQRGRVVDELTLADVNRAAQLFAEPATVTIVRPGK